jgi:hypothetical protein
MIKKQSWLSLQMITCIPPLKENDPREPFFVPGELFVSLLLPPLAANFVLIAPTIIEPKLFSTFQRSGKECFIERESGSAALVPPTKGSMR